MKRNKKKYVRRNIWVQTDASLSYLLRILTAHPYCACNPCRNVTPRHIPSARSKEEMQPSIGSITDLVGTSHVVICSLIYPLTLSFLFKDHFLSAFLHSCERMWTGKANYILFKACSTSGNEFGYKQLWNSLNCFELSTFIRSKFQSCSIVLNLQKRL